FGDPEAQAVLPLLEEDPLPLFLSAAGGSLPPDRHGTFVRYAGAAVCVVLAAPGYPKEPHTGQAIEGLNHARPHGIRFYCAGVDRRAGGFVTSGGRVLGVTARAETLAPAQGVQVFIAGAGMANHLAGAVAAHTTLPVIGVPLGGSALAGVDSLYSTVQMPAGVPVATVAIGASGAKNAAVLAIQILALS